MKHSRRLFLTQLGMLSASGLFPVADLHRSFLAAEALPEIAGQAPLAPSRFHLLPLTAVRPAGWLLRQLQIQAAGLTGHLDEVWPDVGPESGWLGGKGESWERGPYYLDGLLPLAYLLDDAGLQAKAQKRIDWTLNHPSSNGMFGPATNDDWWPRMVMLKALTQYSEATDDKRVVPFMERYFAYQLAELPSRPLRDWGKFRWHDQVVSVLWLFERNGDRKLLELARLLQAQGHNWQRQFEQFPFTAKTNAKQLGLDRKEPYYDELAMSAHGVNNAMALKAGPISWRLSGLAADREALNKQLALLDLYHGLPNGMFSGDEHLAGRDPSQGIELCAVVEAMYSLEHAIAILGDATLGDRLERIAYNALPGTFTDDMWAHQYDQQPNQIECTHRERQWVSNGPESNLFGLEPNYGCCTANLHQGWPKLTSSLWMASDDGLASVVYAPCTVKTKLQNGVPVQITETTDYPFRETVHLRVAPEAPATFALNLRVPEWATETSITINGEAVGKPLPGRFAKISRRWRAGDQVEIRFPMRPRVSRGYKDSITLERGPVVFSLNLDPEWKKVKDRGPASDWSATPGKPWNYGLALDSSTAGHDVTVTERLFDGPAFTAAAPPLELQVKGRLVGQWQEERGSAGPLPHSPVASSEPETDLTLIPYAAAKLRITAFPLLTRT
jgi:hypothetical protein